MKANVQRLAAVDIGTNGGRVLVADLDWEQENAPKITQVAFKREPLRLGLDVFKQGRIGQKRTDMMVDAIGRFCAIAQAKQASHWVLCATSAIREAKNREAVCKAVRERTGFSLLPISGQAEGLFLVQLLRSQLHTLGATEAICIDVGGGSTEIALFSSDTDCARSFPIGTLRKLPDDTKKAQWEDMLQWMDHLCARAPKARFTGLGGNINSAASRVGCVPGGDIYYEDLLYLTQSVSDLSMSERIARLGMRPDRADVFPQAMNIFLKLMHRVGCDRITVQRAGLSDALIYDLGRQLRGAPGACSGVTPVALDSVCGGDSFMPTEVAS